LQPGKIFCFQIRGRVRNGNPALGGISPTPLQPGKIFCLLFMRQDGVKRHPDAALLPSGCRSRPSVGPSILMDVDFFILKERCSLTT